MSALGTSVGMKIGFTLIADCFQGKEALKKISISVPAFAIAPGLAIPLGGFLTTHYGWKSCFYALTIYSLFILLIAYRLHETAPYLDPHAFNLKNMSKGYWSALKTPAFLSGAILLGLGSSLLYIANTLTPFIGISHMHLTPTTYGLLSAIPPCGMLLGSLSSHALSEKWNTFSTLKLGISICILAATAILLIFLFGKEQPWNLFLLLPILYLGATFIFSNSSNFAMHHIEDKANGSAIMGFINMGIATALVFAAEEVAISQITLFPVFLLGISLAMLIAYAKCQKHCL